MEQEKRSQHVGFKTTPAVRARIDALASSERRTVSDVMHMLLEAYFEDGEEGEDEQAAS